MARGRARPDVLLGWAALAAAGIAMAAELWDEAAGAPLAGLYGLGLCVVGWSVHQFHLEPHWLVWTGTMLLSAYSLGTSFLWCRRNALRDLADRLGIPRRGAEMPEGPLAWLVRANLVLAAVVMVLAFRSILTDPSAALRSSAAHAALAEVLAIGLLAQGERRGSLQVVALAVGVVGGVAWGWAWIGPEVAFGGLDRLVVVLTVLIGATILYGLGPAKLLPVAEEWSPRRRRRFVPALMGLAGVVLAFDVRGRDQGVGRGEGRADLDAGLGDGGGRLAGGGPGGVGGGPGAGSRPAGIAGEAADGLRLCRRGVAGGAAGACEVDAALDVLGNLREVLALDRAGGGVRGRGAGRAVPSARAARAGRSPGEDGGVAAAAALAQRLAGGAEAGRGRVVPGPAGRALHDALDAAVVARLRGVGDAGLQRGDLGVCSVTGTDSAWTGIRNSGSSRRPSACWSGGI